MHLLAPADAALHLFRAPKSAARPPPGKPERGASLGSWAMPPLRSPSSRHPVQRGFVRTPRRISGFPDWDGRRMGSS
jgi:hypothetical protein